jgi:hypothetical protein
MDGEYADNPELWYGLYLMGASAGFIEYLDDVDTSEWTENLSEKEKEEIQSWGDAAKQIDSEDDLPDNFYSIFHFARDVVAAESQ